MAEYAHLKPEAQARRGSRPNLRIRRRVRQQRISQRRQRDRALNEASCG